MGGILDMHLGWILILITFILAQKLYFIFHTTLTGKAFIVQVRAVASAKPSDYH